MDGRWSLKLLALVGLLSILAACGAAGDSAETSATTTAAVASTATAPMETTATTEATAETVATDADTGFDAAEYFNGKTVNVVITHSAGGGADLYGRFVATRLGDYIPGNPRVAVTNVGGVGGMRTVFDAPEADLVIGVTSQASALYTVSLDPEAPFDPTQIHMVGGTGGEPRGLVFFGDLVDEYDSLADMAGSAGPSMRVAQTVGSPADLVSDSYFASWLCEVLEAPCEMISVAEDDNTDLSLMIERGEINAWGSGLVTILRDYGPQLSDGSARVAFGYAPDENTLVSPPDDIPVPDILDVLPAEAAEEYNRILPIVGPGGVGKHFWAGPDMSEEVLGALRDGYEALINDSAVLEELQAVMAGGSDGTSFSWEVAAVPGDEMQAAYESAVSTFEENIGYYEERQAEYYGAYWR